MDRRTAEKGGLLFELEGEYRSGTEERIYTGISGRGKQTVLRPSAKNTEYQRKQATSGKIVFSNMDMQGFVTEAERRRTARLSWMKIQ